MKKEIKIISHRDTFKELAQTYEQGKNFHGKIFLIRITYNEKKVEKFCAASFAEFAKIVKSTDYNYKVYKN